MYTVAPAVAAIHQVTQYDCWHASLRMMTKWKNGVNAEPSGTQTDWLYAKCRTAQNGYDHAKANALTGIINPGDIEKFQAGKAGKNAVGNWSAVQTLVANQQKHKPFKGDRPGLTTSLAPAILGENRLRAVRGLSTVEELDGTSAGVEQMLMAHGPLYCLVGWGHVVVVVGVNGDKLEVCDPLRPETVAVEAPLAWVANSACVARLA